MRKSELSEGGRVTLPPQPQSRKGLPEKVGRELSAERIDSRWPRKGVKRSLNGHVTRRSYQADPASGAQTRTLVRERENTSVEDVQQSVYLSTERASDKKNRQI